MHVEDDDPLIMTRIFEPDVNFAIWQQGVEPGCFVDSLFDLSWKLHLKACLPISKLGVHLAKDLPDLPGQGQFLEQVVELSEMFACLFELEQVGLRLQVLDQPMCPRFHVDRVPCRLTATFSGPGTQWLTNQQVNRDFLGPKHPPEEDMEGQLFSRGTGIQQLKAGEVGLMKGSWWEGQESLGLVHRSPGLQAEQKRLLLTLDLA